MVAYMGCFAGRRESDDLARLATLVRLEVMSGCVEARRSCRGLGPLARWVIVCASKSCSRLATRVDRGSGLESMRVSERKYSGESV
jgi:hypothetical protein